MPEQVGLTTLRRYPPGDYADDTNWNEPTALELSDSPADSPAQAAGTFEEFIDRCLALRHSPGGWQPDREHP